MFVFNMLISLFFLYLLSPDLGELHQSQPSSCALREGDCEWRRKSPTERHAVQSRPTTYLHTDWQTGEFNVKDSAQITTHNPCTVHIEYSIPRSWMKFLHVENKNAYSVCCNNVCMLASLASSYSMWYAANNALLTQMAPDTYFYLTNTLK